MKFPQSLEFIYKEKMSLQWRSHVGAPSFLNFLLTLTQVCNKITNLNKNFLTGPPQILVRIWLTQFFFFFVEFDLSKSKI